MSFLIGLPGQAKALLDRFTSGRATNIDNLDVATSTRALESTALDSGDWTSARAAKIDDLDANMTTIAAASTSISSTHYTSQRAGYLNLINTNLDQALSTISGAKAPNSTGAGGVGTNSSSSFTTEYSYSGSGALVYLAAWGYDVDDEHSTAGEARILMDGVNAFGDIPFGGAIPEADIHEFQMLRMSGYWPFSSSVSIQIACTTGGDSVKCKYAVIKT